MIGTVYKGKELFRSTFSLWNAQEVVSNIKSGLFVTATLPATPVWIFIKVELKIAGDFFHCVRSIYVT